mmetsp:Transcript_95675/g.285644  ORF Transcript_95675/g.285644 Transcript_95675/m.285644 type:complete len:238 (-) Transcript_95675:640-1353(-)
MWRSQLCSRRGPPWWSGMRGHGPCSSSPSCRGATRRSGLPASPRTRRAPSRPRRRGNLGRTAGSTRPSSDRTSAWPSRSSPSRSRRAPWAGPGPPQSSPCRGGCSTTSSSRRTSPGPTRPAPPRSHRGPNWSWAWTSQGRACTRACGGGSTTPSAGSPSPRSLRRSRRRQAALSATPPSSCTRCCAGCSTTAFAPRSTPRPRRRRRPAGRRSPRGRGRRRPAPRSRTAPPSSWARRP